MTPDRYLRQILTREHVDTGPLSSVLGVVRVVQPMLQQWGGTYLVSVEPSGSFAKGTCNRSGTDIDLLLSLSSTTPATLAQIRQTLRNRLVQSGYQVRDQNVSLGINVGNYKVDLVPAKRQNPYSADHSLFRRKASTWTKTNVKTHISTVKGSQRTEEIRILKLWRDQKGLDFPSFYLELATIQALRYKQVGNLASNVMSALEFFRDSLTTSRFVDPSNTANVVSEDLVSIEKHRIATMAGSATMAQNWNQIVV